MPLMNLRQIEGGKELQNNMDALLKIVGKDKEAFFTEILNWLLANAPQDFKPVVSNTSRMATLVDSAAVAVIGTDEVLDEDMII